jgi:hypothetical protein
METTVVDNATSIGARFDGIGAAASTCCEPWPPPAPSCA